MYVSMFERGYTAIGKEEGRLEGRLEGRMEGRMEGHAELVKNMWNEGLSVDEISKYTRLIREDVEKFLNL